MSQDFVFTTLPAQKTEIGGIPYLKLSVFVSVRLKSAKATTLNSYPDILSWPEKVLGGDFSFRLGDKNEIEAILVKENIDTELFHSLFRQEIKIMSDGIEVPEVKKIISFPAIHIKDFIFKNYRQTAVESPTKLVSADKFVDMERFAPVSNLSRYRKDHADRNCFQAADKSNQRQATGNEGSIPFPSVKYQPDAGKVCKIFTCHATQNRFFAIQEFP